MVRLEWDVSPILQDLSEFQRRLLKKDDLWDRLIENVIVREIENIFNTDGRGGWEQTNRDNPILRDTYRLFRSYTDAGSSDNIGIRTDDVLTYGSSVEYAIFHETGTSDMPARPVLRLLDEDPAFEQQLIEETQNWISDIERRVFRR